MKSQDFIAEGLDPRKLTTDQVQSLQKKARAKVKEIFNKSFPLPIRSVARGGKGMRGLVFTFSPEDIQTLGSASKKWDRIAKKVEAMFAKSGMKASVSQVIWKNNGELRAKPKVIIDVDMIGKLEDLYFHIQGIRNFGRPARLPHGTAALVKRAEAL